MIDPRLAWFAIGATCSAVVFGWPWHPRFSRFSHKNTAPDSSEARPRKFRDIHRDDHRLDRVALWRPVRLDARSINYPDPSPDRQPTNPFTGKPARPKPEIVPGFYGPRRTVRWFINDRLKIMDCGGPCTAGPTYCDCGELWVDVPTSSPPPSDP